MKGYRKHCVKSSGPKQLLSATIMLKKCMQFKIIKMYFSCIFTLFKSIIIPFVFVLISGATLTMRMSNSTTF